MNKKHLSVVLTAVFTLLSAQMVGQEVNHSIYFIENAPMRHYYNPAFMPQSKVYVSLPVIGWTTAGVANNALWASDAAYKGALNAPIFFFSPQGGNNYKFFDETHRNTLVGAEARINLLSVGWQTKNNAYWHIGLNERVDAGVNLSNDLVKFFVYGQGNGAGRINPTDFDLRNTGLKADVFTELSVGYSRPSKDERWNIGGSFKLLLGNAHVGVRSSDFDINASYDKWTIDVDGKVNMAGPVTVSGIDDEAEFKYLDEDKETIDQIKNLIKPRGFGAAIDFGAAFRPTDWMEISAAVLDLGGIYWNREVQNIAYTGNNAYTGKAYSGIHGLYTDSIMGDLKEGTLEQIDFDSTASNFLSALMPKLNIGVEVYTPNKLIGASLLSHTKMINRRFYEELSIGANLRPCDWFNLNLNYSLINFGQSSFGAGIGLRGGPINLTLAADYIPTDYAYTVKDGNKHYNIPYKQKGLNVGVGLNLTFGNKKDQDKDGVKDRWDQCPDTPRGVQVDSVGCPVDTDKDGVPDYLDQCPDTPLGVVVDSVGCPVDSDKDGVPDYLDQCPDTPLGVPVDSVGCPFDTDGDGVPDYRDDCPDTPAEARGYVDERGCMLDTDGDGVYDYKDECPDTPAEAAATVDEKGCPKDTDQDGVPDYKDECPDTKPEARAHVDERGCDKDTDGDGVPDYLDNCPNTPGSKNNHGCPEVKREIRNLFKKALQGIQFETGKAVIRKNSYPLLDQIAKAFIDNPDYIVEVQGHTDNVGKADYNLDLSNRRANAVRDYLIDKGVDADRLTAHGYGLTMPVADNKTAAGRAKNRRVEFVVSFEEVTYETIKTVDESGKIVIEQEKQSNEPQDPVVETEENK